MEKLKPCPFCACHIINKCYFENFKYLECDACQSSTAYYDTYAQAIKAWNTRTEQ